ncbi:MAG: metal ABC transporter ATP-binding protein [Planctomycetota bacterium]|nr:metal ABC transporter ATP-binding protein [Planctomycetota bacterium]
MTPQLPNAIDVNHLTVSYGPVPALLDVSFGIRPGQIVGIIGPNGSGKSTLIKSILGFIKPDYGSIQLFGQPADQLNGTVAYVPQRGAVDWDFPVTVRDVALMGRYTNTPWWRDLSSRDKQIADDALEMVRMSEFRNRQIGQLSGGQQQRVFMARALAQDSELLLLDEPFSGVDAATERAILDVLRQTKQAGRTTLVVHHDLATAAEYFDQLILLKQRLFGCGEPDKILQPGLLAEVYEGTLRVFSDLASQPNTPENEHLDSSTGDHHG